MQVKSKNY